MAHVARTTSQFRVVLFYTEGQSLGGVENDHDQILEALGEIGLSAEMVDLGDLHLDVDGRLHVRDRATGTIAAWVPPHAALMYHGAIAPDDAVPLLAAVEAAGTTVINGRHAWPVFTDKQLFADYMQARGVRIIPTERVTSHDEMRAALAANGGEAIFKKPISTEGDDIFVIRGAAQLDALALLLPGLGGTLIAQPLIDSRMGTDLEDPILARVRGEELGRRHEFRINTSRMPDGQIMADATYMRIAPDADQVVNNVAQGARGIAIEFEDLHPLDREIVIDAARHAPHGGDIIGWDLIGQPGQRFIIEGNSGSGLPAGDECIDPGSVVDSYATIMLHAAETSSLNDAPVLAAR